MFVYRFPGITKHQGDRRFPCGTDTRGAYQTPTGRNHVGIWRSPQCHLASVGPYPQRCLAHTGLLVSGTLAVDAGWGFKARGGWLGGSYAVCLFSFSKDSA